MPEAPSELLDFLIEKQVISEQSDGSIHISEYFRELIDHKRSTIDNSDPNEEQNQLAILDDSEYLARYNALSTVTDRLSVGDKSHLLIILEQIENGFPPSEGTPTNFLSIRGDQLDFALNVWPNSIIYIWLEECDPCNLVKSDLEESLDNRKHDLGCFAIYGPNNAKMLKRRFNIHGGPYTVFIHHGSVDSRLAGAHRKDVLKHEIETLCELAKSG